MAATSRATPTMLRRSGRLGVTSRSKTVWPSSEAGGCIGGAADDGLPPAAAEIDGGQDEAVGVGMTDDLHALGDADALPVAAGGDDLAHLDAGGGEARGQLLRGEAQVYVFGQPAERNAHGLSELPQEAEVVGVEQPDVLYAVAEHGDALDAEPEGEAGETVGVVAHV